LALAGTIAGASFDATSAPPATAVPVWQATGGVVTVRRNDATNVSEWTLSTVASLALPAGSYLVVAKTVVQDPVVSASAFYCFLVRPAGNFDQSVVYSVQDEPATIALQGVVTLAAAGTITLRCGATGPASASGSAKAYDTKLVAIQAVLQ
jgi:hypothetical protein